MKTLFLTFLGSICVLCVYHSLDIWWSFSKTGSSYGSFELLGRDDTVLARMPREDGFSLPYRGPLDIDLIKNIIQIEDRRFYSHHGIDIIGKGGALIENYQAHGIVRGGSTLTEQYIKNRYFPDAPRTIIQKIKESFYAVLLEFHSDKDTILRGYLDTVYMGNSIYGIETAKELYFSGNIDTNSIIEIITRIKYPNPSDGRESYQKQLSRKLGISNTDFVIPKRDRPQYINTYPHLTERIKKEITLRCSGRGDTLEKFVNIIPENICIEKSLSLRTSIDTKLMDLGKTLLNTTLEALHEKNIHNGSIFVWSEKEKKVIVYLGNGDISRDNAVDMIVKKRSVGSTLKPFVYRLALRRGAHPDNYILDEKKVYETDNADISYIAENYIPKSYGPVTLREALGNSLNSSTVRLSEYLGIGRIYEAYRNIGLDIEHDSGYYGYSISLGGVELTLENLVEGYRDLTDLSDRENFLIFDILSESQNRARTFGVSSILNTSIPLAVKTGTSTDFRDNWTLGYNEDIIVGVWVGNVNRESMDDVSGISGAGPLYHHVSEAMISAGYIVRRERTPPESITYDYICMDTPCLQKRGVYRKNDWTQKSDSIHQVYYIEDFITPLTSEEKVKWKIH